MNSFGIRNIRALKWTVWHHSEVSGGVAQPPSSARPTLVSTHAVYLWSRPVGGDTCVPSFSRLWCIKAVLSGGNGLLGVTTRCLVDTCRPSFFLNFSLRQFVVCLWTVKFCKGCIPGPEVHSWANHWKSYVETENMPRGVDKTRIPDCYRHCSLGIIVFNVYFQETFIVGWRLATFSS